MQVVEPINKLFETVPFPVIAYSLDWHPKDHISFIENVQLRKLDATSKIQDAARAKEYDVVVFEGPPKTEQVLWAEHCVQGTWGAELHKDLKVIHMYIYKHIIHVIQPHESFIATFSFITFLTCLLTRKRLDAEHGVADLQGHQLEDRFVFGVLRQPKVELHRDGAIAQGERRDRLLRLRHRHRLLRR